MQITSLIFFSFIFFIFIIAAFMVYRKSEFLFFSIPVIFIGLSLIDMVIPGILWSIFGFPEKPYWFQPLNYSDIILGGCFYFLFLLIFLVSYYLFCRRSPFFLQKSTIKVDINQGSYIFFLLLTTFFAVFSLCYEIIFSGGLAEWAVLKFTLRFKNDLGELHNSPIGFFLYTIPWRLFSLSMVYLGFLFRFRLKMKFRLVLYLMIFISFILAIATSYRGTILVLMIGFAFIEYIRFIVADKVPFLNAGNSARLSQFYLRLSGLLFIAASLFIVYGAVRDSQVNHYFEREETVSNNEIYRVLSQGSGLEGVSSIVRYFSSSDVLFGKTYIDMLLLPVPRVIYTSKPEWYGIDDITKEMKWPATTQSAVSMPGEAFANFGYFGLIVAIGYGFLFGIVYRMVVKSLFDVILYPLIALQLILVTNWMGFTGFMNAITRVILLFIFMYLLRGFLRKSYDKKGFDSR